MAEAKVIVCANQKGGVGKSTAVMNLGAVLRERSKKVLAIDLDPQHTLTDFWGVREPQYTTYDLLMTDGEWRAYETDINAASKMRSAVTSWQLRS
jgi:cellulose biosynthesis protein BcsQ